MTDHEKSPAQGGEMPPVERAAITGSGGISTVRGATSAGNAAQERAIPWAHTRSGAVRRSTDASKMARRDYGLTDSDSGRHDFDAGFLYGMKYGHLAAGVPVAMITALECTAQWLEHGHDPKAAAAEIRACLAKIDASAAGGSDDVQRELRNDVLFGNHDALDAGANALDRLGASSEAAGVRVVAHELRLVASSVARAATAAAGPASGDAERPS